MTLTAPEELYATLDKILALTDYNAPLDFITDEAEPHFHLSTDAHCYLVDIKPITLRKGKPSGEETPEEVIASIGEGMRKYDIAEKLRNYAHRLEAHAHLLALRCNLDDTAVDEFKHAVKMRRRPLPLDYVLEDEPHFLYHPKYIALTPEEYAVYDLLTTANHLHSKVDGYWNEVSAFTGGLTIKVIEG